MIGVTLTAGAAVIGWVNGQAASSEGALGSSAANQIDYSKESFVVVSVQFYYSSTGAPGVFAACPSSGSPAETYCNEVSVAIYNNGAVGLTIGSISLVNSTKTSVSGAPVPSLSVSFAWQSKSATYTGTASCSGTVGTPSMAAPTQPIGLESVPPSVFTFTLPTNCPTNDGILDGASYTLQVVGLYGNIITTQLTANG